MKNFVNFLVNYFMIYKFINLLFKNNVKKLYIKKFKYILKI